MTLDDIKARTIEEGDCWIWQGATNGSGHPNVEKETARRFVWRLAKGKIPAGHMITTTCLEVKCLNPAHLALTTKSEVSIRTNARTAVKLKRAASSAKTNRAKLGKITMEIARQIRSGNKTGREWARELGVSTSLISCVRNNKSWVEHSSPWAGLGA